LTASLALLLTACGGSADPTPPTCAPGELRLTGTLDGVVVSQQMSVDSYVFGNAINQESGTLVAPVVQGEAPKLKITFTKLVANGGSVAARGELDFSATGGVHAGNCETGDEASTFSMDKDGDGATFVLRQLHSDPYCTSPELDGALAGCVRFDRGP